MKGFGDRLRLARDAKRLSQEGLVDRVGRNPRTIMRWEAGETRPTARDGVSLAKALEVDYEWLASGKGAGPVVTHERLFDDEALELLARASKAASEGQPRERIMLMLYAFADRLDSRDPAEMEELERIKRQLLEPGEFADDAD